MGDVERGPLGACMTHDADAEVLELYSDDCPDAPGGRAAVPGDSRWMLCLRLVDGRRLHLFLGPEGHHNFVAMLAAEAVDDAEEQL